jgi:hypothetical protein
MLPLLVMLPLPLPVLLLSPPLKLQLLPLLHCHGSITG